MALGDVKVYDEGAFGYPGDIKFGIAASATLLNAGEPVLKALGNSTGNVVSPLATSSPVVGTTYMAGIAATTSTNTAGAAGTVSVMKMLPGQTYLCAPAAPTSWDTQAEYDALVGARVLFQLSAGVYTILASDGSTNGLVVEPLDIVKYPGMVRFSIRDGASYLA